MTRNTTVAMESQLSLMTAKEHHVMQTQPLSRITVNEIEDLLDKFRALAADGVLCRNDQAKLLVDLEEVYEAAIATDEAQAISVATLRNGPQSPRVKLLTKVYVLDHYRNGGSDNGPQAA